MFALLLHAALARCPSELPCEALPDEGVATGTVRHLRAVRDEQGRLQVDAYVHVEEVDGVRGQHGLASCASRSRRRLRLSGRSPGRAPASRGSGLDRSAAGCRGRGGGELSAAGQVRPGSGMRSTHMVRWSCRQASCESGAVVAWSGSEAAWSHPPPRLSFLPPGEDEVLVRLSGDRVARARVVRRLPSDELGGGGPLHGAAVSGCRGGF